MKTCKHFLSIGASVLLLSCQSQDASTSPDDAALTRAVAARISAGTVSSSIWTSTDSVILKVTTTANDILLDTGFSLVGKNGVIHLKSVQVRSDLGITMMAKGFVGGFPLWEGMASGAASSESQTLEMTVAMADTVAVSTGPSLGTVNAPVLDSIRTHSETKRYQWGPGDATLRFEEPVRVFLSDLTDSATIFYTLDGKNPTITSPVYRDTGLVIDSSRTLKAMAVRNGYTNSVILGRLRFDLQAIRPRIGWGGMYDNMGMSNGADYFALNDGSDSVDTIRYSMAAPVRFGLWTLAPNADTRFTLDGREPTSTDSLYTDSLLFAGERDTMTIRAAVFSRHPGVKPSISKRWRLVNEARWNKTVAYGSLTDLRDGQVYKTVTIGGQTWMAQNLNYKPTVSNSDGRSKFQ